MLITTTMSIEDFLYSCSQASKLPYYPQCHLLARQPFAAQDTLTRLLSQLFGRDTVSLTTKSKTRKEQPFTCQSSDLITMSITHALDRKLVSYQPLIYILYSSQPIETAFRVLILIPKAQTKPSLPPWLTTASYPRQPAYDCPFSLHP